MRYGHISIAIPILAEYSNLPRLLQSLKNQSFGNFSLYFCVNNREAWSTSNNESERTAYVDNQKSLEYLNSLATRKTEFKEMTVLDCSSRGQGWNDKKHGVGWARKTLFDCIDSHCDDNEQVVSLDADTDFSSNYLESVLCTMNKHPEHSALSVPYYHPLSGNDHCDRAMLRYEIYMRHYLLNLMESSNPYAFTALGSAMVFPLWAYRRVGGITPLQGGEDYYLMQKFAKTGSILHSCNEVVKPQGRISLRVPFGTGPAIAKGIDSMDSNYPLYPYEAFQTVAETFATFPQLYDEERETPMSEFLQRQLKTKDIWQPLRKNFKTRELFVHACQERVDGLRILQFLKTFPLRTAEEELHLFCNRHAISIPDDFNFRLSPVEVINRIRDELFALEKTNREILDEHTIK